MERRANAVAEDRRAGIGLWRPDGSSRRAADLPASAGQHQPRDLCRMLSAGAGPAVLATHRQSRRDSTWPLSGAARAGPRADAGRDLYGEVRELRFSADAAGGASTRSSVT